MRPLRIMFLLTQSLESPSGLGRYWPLSKELGRLGHEVTILALHHDYQATHGQQLLGNGVRVRYVGQMHVRKTGSTKTYFGSGRLLQVAAIATWQLAKAALASQVDLYHLGKPHPMNGVAVLLPALLRRRRVYLDCDDYEAASNYFNHGWQRAGVAHFENQLPRISTGITANTRFTVARLVGSGYPAQRIVYVPNGADRERFADIDSYAVDALRRQLKLGGQKVVLYVGSLSLTNHPVELLMEAFGLVHGVEPDAVLVIVGGGADYTRLQMQADAAGLAGAVRFVGHVSSEKAPAYYVLADVSVDPVRDDIIAKSRSPLKLVESLAAGTPVVTGDVGDRGELLSGGGGLLVSPGSAPALADGLLEVLRNPWLRNRLRAEALDVRQRFFWDHLVHDFARVYDAAR
jgi:glycosyltransferase involved in cell wall biosynthesis